MYEITNYTSTNNLGTAVLLEALIDQPVEQLIVASSMSIYGEGLYKTPSGNLCTGNRQLEQLKAGDWEVRNTAQEVLLPIPTPETKQPTLASVYALSKFDQEQMCLIFGKTYGINSVGLRFFNTYGTRQALSNPYTGVLAIFASRLLNNNPPLIFEDGYQKRDFVSIHDVVQACRLAMEIPEAAGKVFNVASDRQYTVLEAAQLMAKVLGKEHIQPLITEKYRVGDVRHCFADITQARATLGYKPCVTLEDGLVELATWLEGQVAFDRVVEASAELAARGLSV
jgi:dTDP-L-rhamnose 4-epimerase